MGNVSQNLNNVVPAEGNPYAIRKEVPQKERPNPLRYPFIIDHHKEKDTQQFRTHQPAKISKFVPYTPYNIMEELKKTPKMIMFNALRIPSQLDLLQEDLNLQKCLKGTYLEKHY